MPPRKTAAPVSPLAETPFPPIPRPEAEDVEFTEETNDQALLRVLNGLDGNAQAMVKIYRQGKVYRDQTYIDECTPDEFEIAMLKDAPYNGGHFRIHVHNADGSLIANKEIKVEPRPVREAAAPPDTAVQALLAPINQQMGQLADAVKSIATLVQTTMANNKQPSMIELLEQMKLMQAITSPAVVAQAPAVNPLTQLKETIELVKALMPAVAGGGGDDTMSFLSRGMETLGKPLMEYMALQQAQKMQAAPQPGAAHQLQPPVYEQPAPTPDEQNMDMIKMYFGMLIGKAQQNADPYHYAGLIVDNADDAMIDNVVRPADYMDRLAVIDERVRLYPEWFEQLRQDILDILTESAEPGNSAGVDANRGSVANQPSLTGATRDVSTAATAPKTDTGAGS